MKTMSIKPAMITPAAGGAKGGAPSGAAGSFGETLKAAVREVNDLQNRADEAVERLQLQNQGSIHEAIIALEKADITFRTMLQVRNKVLDAYQEIMRMTV
ncbi:MAG TPA: flagellar hook-basal body complex protein FliE [Syntrophales bacterium]|nr:flagellar hook-basal body complex protein FliE [Syntrophales bacterium]HOM07615.1 flagellar hook-basal body complex protein FliE [Syntrophales bacterium]HPQ06700.1 flagellar hook-basal body complex protein FliE [Syntrophales bacterium]